MDNIIPQDDTPHKCCPDCNQFKPITNEYFQKNAAFRSGFETRCRVCQNARDRARNALKREEINASARAQYAKNLEHSRAMKRANYYAHIDWAKQYRSLPEVKERNRQWSAEYRALPKMREHNRQRGRVYYVSHKAQAIARRHKRISRQRGVPGTHTAQEIREQYQRQKGKCYYCSCKLGKNRNDYHVDHTFPLDREGARNSIDHLVITCKFCNLSKGNKYPWEWPQGGRLL